MTSMEYFWDDLTDTVERVEELARTNSAQASKVMSSDLHESSCLWPFIEADIKANPIYRNLFERALRVRDLENNS